VVPDLDRGAGADLRQVLKSTDGGLTWADSSNRISRNFALALAVDPKDHENVYAGTIGGVFSRRPTVESPGSRPAKSCGTPSCVAWPSIR
jgi:hypothetical protein